MNSNDWRTIAGRTKSGDTPPAPDSVPGHAPADLQQALIAAIHLHQAERFEEAQTLYRQILGRDPNHADALHLLGLVAHQTGRHADAVALIGQAVALHPKEADYHNNRGEALRALGRLEEAIADYHAALALAPADTGILFNLGSAMLANGQADEAVAILRQAVAGEPRFAEAHNGLGLALKAQGAHADAIAAFRKAVELDKRLVEAQVNLASALTEDGEVAEAETRYRKALKADPENVEAHFGLGMLVRGRGRHAEAAVLLRRALALRPDVTAAWLPLAVALTEIGEYPTAEPIFRTAVDADPEDVSALTWLGICVENGGDSAAAEALYEKALAIDAGYAMAHCQLAGLRKTNATAADIDRLRPVLETPSLTPESRIRLTFALGDLLDGAGRQDEAFGCYHDANEMVGGAACFDADAHTRHCAALRATFTTALMADKTALGSDSERPIFVLGLPCSGTTRVARILARHARICSAGPLPDIGDTAAYLPEIMRSKAPYPDCIAALTGKTVDRVTGAYLRLLQSESEDAARVVDAMPENFLHVGLIALLFPRAQIIHCRREPLDTLFTCYTRFFADNRPFSYDLDNLASLYRDYEAIMAHWHALLPGRILDVSLADLARDPEGQSRRLVAHCGLDWDEACLAEAAPDTLPEAGRWRAYEKQLAPLIEVLDRAATSEG